MTPTDILRSRIDQFLDTTGDGTGTINSAVNGSVTPVLFKISPPSSGLIEVHRMMVIVRDDGAFSAATYGNKVALTNGMQVGIYDDTTGDIIQDYTLGGPIKDNADWGEHCYDVDLKTWGQGDQFLLVRWTFALAGITPTLVAGSNRCLGVKVRDDLSSIVYQRFKVQGFRAGYVKE